MHRGDNVESAEATVPAEVKLGDAPPSCSPSHTVNKCPFHSLVSAMFSHFCAFCW